ncbi:hypothetical protein J6590_067400 [Homalodisca vitripennis]|nr:hypothetical protein J6590_067400 [Homalodisca vitripennis]
MYRVGPTILTPKHRAGSSRERAASFDFRTPTTETLRCPRPTEARREESKKPNSRYLENLKTRTNQTGRIPQKHLEIEINHLEKQTTRPAVGKQLPARPTANKIKWQTPHPPPLPRE